MMVRRAFVSWKRENGRVLIMSKDGVFLLNKKGSELWESFDGRSIKPLDYGSFITCLEDLNLVRRSN
jgi:hypothetical protein